MEVLRLPAHFDGDNIILDEPFDLKPGTKLLVTVLDEQLSTEHHGWLSVSKRGLEKAFGIDEPEYTLDSIKEANPDYKGG